MTSLIAGFTLAAGRVSAAAIHTDSVGLTDGLVQIPVADGHLPAYYARPVQGSNLPTILVVEEVFGVHEYIKDVCRRFAKLGYLAVAPELYARIGDLSQMNDVAQIMRDVIDKAPDAQIDSDLDAAAAWAAAQGGDPNRLGITGFCRGGRVTWLYATHNAKLRAAVSWYGQIATSDTPIQPHNPMELVGDLKCPVLGLYGTKDNASSVDNLHALEARAKADGKTVDIVLYPGVGHAFHADYRPSYVPSAAEDGWTRCLAWFKKYGVG